ncbi:MAG TPA: ABC transporter permease subunit [Anaerolineales bacterium]|jgi:ABC-2 type transport system permease protein|nr:ABC transporter permease subunit [Anaerolineales bacterium]
MRNIWIIAKREYNHFFISPIAYVVAFMVLVTIGIIFAINILYFIQNAFQAFGQTPDITPVTGAFGFLLVLAIPAITMRLLADEARMGTLELLLTAPVTDFELVAGKWLGGFLFILTVLAVTLIYPLLLHFVFVSPGIDQQLVISSYLGVILVTASFLALGVGISAIFTNQVAAFFVTLSVFVFLWWLVGFPAQLLQGTGGEVFQYLNMQSHFYDAFNQGRVYLTDIIYFVSLIALGLFIGTSAIESRRWR